MLPPNPAQEEQIFATALRGLSLSVGGKAGQRFSLMAEDAEMPMDAPCEIAPDAVRSR